MKRMYRLQKFWIGTALCTLGIALIGMNDGSESVPHKVAVAFGLALTLGGVASHRHLLFTGKLPRDTSSHGDRL